MTATVTRSKWKIPPNYYRGYRIEGSIQGFAWISRRDAYDLCCALADLIDEDNGVVDD